MDADSYCDLEVSRGHCAIKSRGTRGASAFVEFGRAGNESFSVGFDMLRLPRSYDTGLVAVFSDRTALDEYTVHPDHVKVAEFGRGISEAVASVDFES